MRKNYNTNHTFAVCAYRESPYLEECLRSLLAQRIPSNIIVCTSTPNAHIQGLAGKYGLPLYVREGGSDIQTDWNFAYDTANTQFVTIAHQDDVYGRDYTRVLLEKAGQYADMSIFFCSYVTIKGTDRAPRERSSLVKRLLCLPVSLTGLADRSWLKKSCLCLGNAISCPMTTYNKNIVGPTPFRSRLKYALDWEMYWKLSCRPGRFVYERKPQGFFRVHAEATSKKFIMNHKKEREDVEMFRHFWPEWMVRVIMKAYRKSCSAYD